MLKSISSTFYTLASYRKQKKRVKMNEQDVEVIMIKRNDLGIFPIQ